MKNILFVFILLIIISSCRKKVRNEDYVEKTSYSSEAIAPKPFCENYQGVFFKLEDYWKLDTTVVDEGVYKMQITNEYSDGKIIINIHDAIINENSYLKTLKMQITSSGKTKNAVFTDVENSIVEGLNVWKCTYSGSEANDQTYSGIIKVYLDKKHKRTYGLLALRPNHSSEDKEFMSILNSLKIGED